MEDADKTELENLVHKYNTQRPSCNMTPKTDAMFALQKLGRLKVIQNPFIDVKFALTDEQETLLHSIIQNSCENDTWDKYVNILTLEQHNIVGW